jgi:hypothetical protein
VKRATLVATAIAWVALAADARAQDAPDDVLAPGTHPMFVDAGFGPSIFMGAASDGGSAEGGFTQFKLWQEVGYHFSGDASGPAIGFNIEEAFVENVRIQPGAKFWYDIPITDFGLYVTPSAKLGYSGTFADGYSAHNFNINLGLRGRLVLADVATLFVQPVGIDMLAGDMGFGAFWDIMIGGGVIFL